jgi:signal transduction histidine kinase
VVAAATGAVGFALNLLPLNISWGVDLIFGGCIALVAVRAMPLAPGLLAVVIAAIPTFFHWGHLAAIGLMAGEAVVLSLLKGRGRPFVWSSSAYWIVFGGPATFILGVYSGLDPQGEALLRASKLALNGIVNVAVAEIFFILALRVRWLRPFVGGGAMISIRTAILSLIVCFVAVPALIAASIFSLQTMRLAERGLTSILQDFCLDASMRSNAILLRSSGNVGALVSALTVPGFKLSLGSVAAPELVWWEEFFTLGAADPGGDPVAESCWVPALRDALAHRDEAAAAIYLPQNTSCAGGLFLVARLAGPLAGSFAVARTSPQAVATVMLGVASMSVSRRGLPWSAEILDREGRVLARAASEVDGSPDLSGEPADRVGTRVPLPTRSASYWSQERRDPIGRATGDVKAIEGWRMRVAVSARPLREEAKSAQAAIFAMALGLVSVVTLLGHSIAAATARRLNQLAASSAVEARAVPVEEVEQLDAWIRRARDELRLERSAADTFRARLKAFEAMAPIVTYVAEGDGASDFRVIAYSPSIQRVLGVAPEAAVVEGWWEAHLHPDDLARLDQARRSITLGPGALREVYRLRGADGRYRWFLDTIVRLPGSDRSRLLHGLMLEVTDQKKAEHHLVQAAKLVQLGELAVSMGHELSQPLNVIKLAAANLIAANDSGQVPRDQLAIRLERIMRQVEKATTLLEHLKVFGRSQTGSPVPFPVLQAIDDALLVLRGTLANHEIALEFSPGLGGPLARGQAVLFEQVVLNLISNAIDAIEQRKQREPDLAGRIVISVCDDGPMIQVRVADNGGGVPDEVASRLFEPFFTTKPPGKGTGLGLSIGARVLEEMGGSLSFANTSEGAAFTIAVPHARQHSEPASQAGS